MELPAVEAGIFVLFCGYFAFETTLVLEADARKDAGHEHGEENLLRDLGLALQRISLYSFKVTSVQKSNLSAKTSLCPLRRRQIRSLQSQLSHFLCNARGYLFFIAFDEEVSFSLVLLGWRVVDGKDTHVCIGRIRVFWQLEANTSKIGRAQFCFSLVNDMAIAHENKSVEFIERLTAGLVNRRDNGLTLPR